MRSVRISLFHGSNQPFEVCEDRLCPSDLGELLVRSTLLLSVGLIYIPLLDDEHALFLVFLVK